MTKQPLQALVSLAFFLTPLFTHPAWAARQGKTTITIQGNFGIGGEVTFEAEALGGKEEIEDDLETTMGFGLWVDHGLSDKLSVGADARVLWFNTEELDENDIDRSMFIDVGPSVRFSFEPVPAFTLYLRGAPGLSILIPSDDLEDESGMETGIGFNIAAFGGTQVQITEAIGFLLELGFVYRMVFGEGKDGAVGYDYTGDTAQFHLHFGMYF